MTVYVLDASVVVKCFFFEEHSEECKDLLRKVDQFRFIAPNFIWGEVGNVIWKKFRRREITDDEALESVSDALEMPVLDISSKDLLPSAVEIAVAVGISVYDALYLSLALSRDCLLITADKKLVNKLAGTPFEQSVRHVSQLIDTNTPGR